MSNERGNLACDTFDFATIGNPIETAQGAVVEAIQPGVDLEQAFVRLAHLPHCLFLDSARRHSMLGRYSFLAADPFDYLHAPADASDALAVLAKSIAPFQTQSIPGLPLFQGGAAGLLSYDLGRSLERVPLPRYDEYKIPALAVGLYDVVVTIDHEANRAWIISQGYPELDAARRRHRARQRLGEFKAWLNAEPATRPTHTVERIRAHELAPRYAVPGPAGLTSNFSREKYLAAVERAIEYIRAGDIFQVNIAQRLLLEAQQDSVTLYQQLRRRNPATFAGYFDLGMAQILSASPERFLRVSHGDVEARPIKGTRARIARPEADLFAGDELLQNQKDRAENVMIVDLLRNDLSRVCLAGSVQVTQLCGLETYEFVQHLVSAVCGSLAPGQTAFDLLRASFPGGSITGAPKVRAMEIIAELEPTARGAYCGALGYIGFDGSMDTNILIRTITASHGWWQAQVGGGIVAQSVPEREYEETWHKATGLLRAFS